jgi:hypothetical protein
MSLLDSIRPKWKNSDADVRVEAIKETADGAVLVEIARDDKDYFVRHEAFARLREVAAEQKFFADLARTGKDEEIRRKAVKALKDETVLEDVAKNDKYRYIRDAAELRLDELRNNTFGEK